MTNCAFAFVTSWHLTVDRWIPLFRLRFPLEDVPEWAQRYAPSAADWEREVRITDEIAPAVRNRGYYTRDEFLVVCRWKSSRPQRWQKTNDERLVRRITRLALAATDDATVVGTMRLLKGVELPTASALLHFVREDYPILDFRALWSLSIDQPTYYSYTFWRAYRRYISLIARSAGLPIRTLDRALWQYAKEGMPSGANGVDVVNHDALKAASEQTWRDRMWLRPDRCCGDYSVRSNYALTIYGYTHAQRVWGLREPLDGSGWDRSLSHRSGDGRWRGHFEDLRACLFFVQRGIKWTEGSADCPDLHRMLHLCYRAVCDAWDDEHAAHMDDVQAALRYTASRDGN